MSDRQESNERVAKQSRATLAIIVGTRPEAIKLAPLMRVMRRRENLDVVVINSGQHLPAVRHMLSSFGLAADLELAALPALPNLASAVRHLRTALRAALRRVHPAAVVVQGDTLTAYAGARAAHDAAVPIAHVEAGLRTSKIGDPFPEEWFRRRIAPSVRWHLAPCRSAVEHLLAEGIAASSIHRVGNTGIDSLRELLHGSAASMRGPITSNVIVTLHRRENWDANAEILCDALVELAARRPDVRIVFPVHPNPRIAKRIRRRLGTHLAVQLVEPMEYREFIRMVSTAALVISDSGGIQEEVAHLGTPLIVPRTNTERPECLATGFVQLVPVARERIVAAAVDLLSRPRPRPLAFDDEAPFGAGDAAERIATILESDLCAAARR